MYSIFAIEVISLFIVYVYSVAVISWHFVLYFLSLLCSAATGESVAPCLSEMQVEHLEPSSIATLSTEALTDVIVRPKGFTIADALGTIGEYELCPASV
eukprot:m.128609 g.128609  ORF g.128609 m.128609 type:complete len:99 (+) comp13874_c2_seq2:1246-1542(+)